MASTQFFLSHLALTSPTTSTRFSSQRQVGNVRTKAKQFLVCKAQKQDIQEDDGNNIIVSRRLALTVLIGGAVVGSKVSPADAAYGQSGILLSLFFIIKLYYLIYLFI